MTAYFFHAGTKDLTSSLPTTFSHFQTLNFMQDNNKTVDNLPIRTLKILEDVYPGRVVEAAAEADADATRRSS